MSVCSTARGVEGGYLTKGGKNETKRGAPIEQTEVIIHPKFTLTEKQTEHGNP